MAAGRTPGGFGSTLREARERRGVSLREIADATKISVSALEALERNDISRLPGGIFSRSFVRSYAAEVGLDPERTIDAFIAQFPDDSVTAGHPAAALPTDSEAVDADQRIASGAVRLAAISLPIVLVVLYFGAFGLPSSESSAPIESGRAVGADAGIDRIPAVAGTASVAERRLTVSLEALVACWVSLSVDGEHQFARTLQPGERYTAEAGREAVLTVADAAALRIHLNGAQARPLGQPGDVVTRRLTPANYNEYLAAR